LVEEIARQERERIAKKNAEGIGGVRPTAPALTETVNRPRDPRPMKEADLGEAQSIPVVKMVFEDQEDFDADINGDVLNPRKR